MNEKPTAQQIADELLKDRKDQETIAVNPPVKKESAIKTAAKIEPKIKSAQIKPKLYYDVKVECMLPATLTYRVLAEDPQQAAELIRGTSPVGVKHRLIGKKDLKLSVYDAGSSMMRWAKNLLGS